jgi:hypothetical protein
MTHNEHDDAPQASAENLKNRRESVEKVIQALQNDDEDVVAISAPSTELATTEDPPWALEQFFNGEIDLDVELASRFSSTPLMSTIKVRSLGSSQDRTVAMMGTQDGSAQLFFDADRRTKVVQVSFTFASMLTLRFVLKDLVDRSRWLELMRREEGGLAFLWGDARWTQDYVICIARKYYTNFYAFSPNGFEAAARMTPEITRKLLDWLDDIWQDDDEPEEGDESPPLLTW